MTSVQSKVFRVLSGLHAGAELTLKMGQKYRLGSDPECDIVLFDHGVVAKHCILKLDEKGVRCGALDAPFLYQTKEIIERQTTRVGDLEIVQCGKAMFAIGESALDESAWRKASTLARAIASGASIDKPTSTSKGFLNRIVTQSRSNLLLLSCVGLVLLGLLLAYLYHKNASAPVVASPKQAQNVAPAAKSVDVNVEKPNTPVVTNSSSSVQDTLNTQSLTVDSLRDFLKKLQLVDAEFVVQEGPAKKMLVRAYLHEISQTKTLEASLVPYASAVTLNVFLVDELVDKVAVLAAQHGVDCNLQYMTEGQIKCQVYPDQAAKAAHFQGIARQVNGVSDLVVTVVPLPGRKN